MENQQVNIRRILAAIIVVLEAALVYLIAVPKSEKNSAVIPTPTPSPTPQDETAGWKTYRNEEYNFEFQYPENFYISFDESLDSNSQSYTVALASTDNLVNWEARVFMPQTNYYAPDLIEKERTIEVDGVSCQHIFTKVLTRSKTQAVICRMGGYDYVIDYDDNNPDANNPEQLGVIYSQILATFKLTSDETAGWIKYTNNQYGFSFSLPESWTRYTIVINKWEGHTLGEQGVDIVVQGPEISIRHPKWTSQVPRQDIPIIVFTIAQWNDLQNGEFWIGAAPIGPSELGRNDKYVFALPARYNYSLPQGFEEVEEILQRNPLRAF